MAIAFDGVNDYAHDAGHSFGGAFTVSMWVKTTDNDTADGFHIWGQQKNSGTPQPYMVIVTNFRPPSSATADELGPYVSPDQGSSNRDYYTSNNPGFYDGVWHNLLLWRNGADTDLYVDGTAIAKTTVQDDALKAGNTMPLDKIAFGASWKSSTAAPQFEVDCDIGEYAVWDRALTAAEIALLQVAGPTAIMNGLADYKPMRRSTVEPIGGNGLTLVNGAAAISDHPPVSYPSMMNLFTGPAAGAEPPAETFMDGVMTEDEWWTRRRKQFWHRKVHGA